MITINMWPLVEGKTRPILFQSLPSNAPMDLDIISKPQHSRVENRRRPWSTQITGQKQVPSWTVGTKIWSFHALAFPRLRKCWHKVEDLNVWVYFSMLWNFHARGAMMDNKQGTAGGFDAT